MRQRGALILLLVAVLGCHKSKSEVVLLVKTLSNPFFQSMKAGAETATSRFANVSIRVQGGSREDDVATQRDLLRQYLLSIPAGICITPTSTGGVIDDLKSLNNKGVPIVVLDTDLASADVAKVGLVYYFVGSDNHEGGQLAAKRLAQLMKEQGNILLLDGVRAQATAEERRTGFMEELSKHPGLKIGLERTANWRRAEAREIVRAEILAGRSYEGIFAANDEMALGAIEALKTSEKYSTSKKLPLIVGFDATKEALESIEAGELSATVKQQPNLMGAACLEILEDLWMKKPVASHKLIDVQLVPL